jgi:hypothetical protein
MLSALDQLLFVLLVLFCVELSSPPQQLGEPGLRGDLVLSMLHVTQQSAMDQLLFVLQFLFEPSRLPMGELGLGGGSVLSMQEVTQTRANLFTCTQISNFEPRVGWDSMDSGAVTPRLYTDANTHSAKNKLCELKVHECTEQDGTKQLTKSITRITLKELVQ